MVTKSQVQNWIDTHNHKWIDFDGAYGAQCMDLSVQYAHDLFGFRLTGNAENLRNQALPAGWQRIKNSNGFVPKLGDIFVWYGTAHPYGHTGIVISADLNTYTAIEQNMVTGTGAQADRAEIHTRAYPADFWGVVRPPITESQAPQPPATGGGGRVAQKGTFKANTTVNIRRDANTTSGKIVAQLQSGQTVNYDSYVDAGGFRWVSYIGNSGQRNFVAVKQLSNGYRFGLCY